MTPPPSDKTRPNTEPRLRVLLVDDHAVVRAGLRMLLESRPGWTVIGEAGDASQALLLTRDLRPDVIVLDLDLGDEDGLGFLPELLASCDKTRVLVLTALAEPALHQRAMNLGAMGVVLKHEASHVILRAVECVHAGRTWIEGPVASGLLTLLSRREPDATSGIGQLTKREREIVGLIAAGLKNRDIGSRLFISETTVRHHLTSIFDKLGVSDRLELLIFAYKHGLATPLRMRSGPSRS